MNTQSAWDVPRLSGAEVASLDRVNAAVFYLDKELHVTLQNELARELLNTPSACGQTIPLNACVAPESEEYQTLAHMIVIEREYRDAIIRWEVDGRVRHVLLDSFAQMADESGHISGMHVMMKDLGNFSSLEQQVQRTEKLATIGKVAAGVAHEFRNPLTTVKGFLQMMQSQFSDSGMETEFSYTQVMLTEIERVDSLISELLLLSEPRQLERSACSVAAVFDEMEPFVLDQANARGIQFEAHLDRSLVAALDATLLQKVGTNLVRNALEAMEPGGTLRIETSRFRRWVRIDVSDTGPGIPYYQMDKIFDAFFTTKDKGMGLGLPICQKIVDNHGGEIRVSSKGFGTTFSVLLPYAEQGSLVV